jgi:hypothetical protein
LVVRLSRFHLRFGLSQPGASTFDRDYVVVWVDFSKKLSCVDRLSIDNIDVCDGTVDSGADRDDMSVDLRIVGVFIRGQIAPPWNRGRRPDEKEQDH